VNRPHEHELPLLGGIAAFLAWLESLAVIVSGPLLTLGLGIALVALLTDGALLTTAPWLLYTWAVTQAIGVDAQLVGSAFMVRRSLHAGRPWAAVGYGVLVVLLAVVAYIAAQVFATQQAQSITTAQALQQLGMDGTTWIVQRSALSVLLVILSGLLRYIAPAKVKVSAEHEREQLQRELELEPLRQRLRAQRTVGVAALARQALSAATGREPTSVPVVSTEGKVTPSERPPTGPGTPSAAKPSEPPAVRTPSQPRRQQALRLVDPDAPKRPQRTAAQGSHTRSTKAVHTPRDAAAAERAARAAWVPGMSVSELERAAGISRAAAGKHRRILMAEAGQTVERPTDGQQTAL
jgi:hypothetical protein